MCQLELGVANRCVRLLSCEETRCCGVPVCDGCQNHAHLIDQVLLYKRPIDGATATDHQPLDTELVELAEHQLVIDLLLACDNVWDFLATQKIFVLVACRITEHLNNVGGHVCVVEGVEWPGELTVWVNGHVIQVLPGSRQKAPRRRL